MRVLNLVAVVAALLGVFADKAFASDALAPISPELHGRLFVLQGSNTVGARLAPELARDYLVAKGLADVAIQNRAVENEYRVVGWQPASGQAVSIDIAAHGSSTAFSGLLARGADIGMSSRPIKASEVAALAGLGDMRSFAAEKVVAIDGLAVIVHPESLVAALSIEQIAKIFAGDIVDWQQVGAVSGRINLYARDDRSGTWDTFKSLVLGADYRLHPAARRFESNDEIARLVQNDKNGIGFVGLASVGKAKALAVADNNTRALQPTRLAVATEDYPLARRLFMYASPLEQSPYVREFLAFAQSEAGQARAEAVGYIAQTPIGLPPADLAQAQPAYRALVGRGERLSVNIRFKDGSAELDNKALQDIQRLSRFMQKAENQGRQLLLVGFGDTKQTPRRALVLSKLRAVAVRSALLGYGVQTLPVQGLGDVLPVADNQSPNKTKNQRVEIWLL